jgi:hypothetical protein
MKKALMFFAWLLMMLILIRISVRCEKETIRGCYECNISTTTEYPGKNPRSITVTSVFEYCDVTEQYVRFWVIGNTWSDTTSHMKQIAKCRMK